MKKQNWEILSIFMAYLKNINFNEETDYISAMHAPMQVGQYGNTGCGVFKRGLQN